MRAAAAIFICLCALLQSLPPARADERPAITANPRFDETYTFLSDPAKQSDFFDPIKYIPLGSDPESYISLGGEVRERYEGFVKNPLFGLNHLSSDDYWLSRTLLHAEVHFNENFRSFVQLGYHNVFGKEGAVTATERSRFDVQQAFAEGDLPLGDSQKILLRAGRQEMPLGSQRLVSYREGPNIRQSFDALRGIYTNGPFSLTGFASRPVKIEPDSFDDTADHAQFFDGLYLVTPVTGNMHADLYYLDLSRDNAKFAQGTADERRYSAGTRIWDNKSTLDYNFEFVYQWGTFGQGDISAWTAASDTGYTLKQKPWQPRIGLKADIASGDRNKNSADLNTFNALFPKGAYFTENALIGPANFIDLQPNVTVKPRADVSLNFGADVLWRQTTQDAIYRQPNIPIAGTAGEAGRYTGTQSFVLGTWQANPHLSLTGTYVHFSVGDAITRAGGKDDDYVGAWVAYKF